MPREAEGWRSRLERRDREKRGSVSEFIWVILLTANMLLINTDNVATLEVFFLAKRSSTLSLSLSLSLSVCLHPAVYYLISLAPDSQPRSMDPDHMANGAANRLCHLSTAESKTNRLEQLCFLAGTGSRREDLLTPPPVPPTWIYSHVLSVVSAGQGLSYVPLVRLVNFGNQRSRKKCSQFVESPKLPDCSSGRVHTHTSVRSGRPRSQSHT